tara:strand:- start:1337 stop:1885 length:549 start_codon:yes stop_codon:yes gene_type:complete
MKVRKEYRYNPFDFDVSGNLPVLGGSFQGDIALGLTLPLSNDGGSGGTTIYEQGGLEGVEPTNVKKPIESQSDFRSSYTTLDQARSNLQNLVLTNKGERVMHPNFGCDVWKMLFDFELKQINVQLKKVIIEQTKMWLPYITVDDVLFDRVDGDDHTLSINIIFSLLGNKINMQTMNLTVGNM